MLKSQDLMLSLSWEALSQYLNFGTPEKVDTVTIDTHERLAIWDRDISMKITAGSQHCFFCFMPSVNDMSHLWHFLENLILSQDTPSIYYCEQEGPVAVFYVSSKGECIVLTVLEEGWYEFSLPINKKKPFTKVYNDNFSVQLNIECPRKAFIKEMYKILRSFEYPTDKNDGLPYEMWENVQRDSEIVKKYCEE